MDFGEADFNVNGVCRRMKYLTVSFPYSNDGFTQVFGGKTAECVCQGLRNIFEYIGGVPPLLIFDNATGVGKRVGSHVHETELFRRFRAYYGCRVKFCNPYAVSCEMTELCWSLMSGVSGRSAQTATITAQRSVP